MDQSRANRSEYSIRFGFGFLFGAALAAWCAWTVGDLDSTPVVAVISIVGGSLAGLAAMRYGDSFWQRCASVLRWWS